MTKQERMAQERKFAMEQAEKFVQAEAEEIGEEAAREKDVRETAAREERAAAVKASSGRAAKEKANLEKTANEKRAAKEKAAVEEAANDERAAKLKADLEKAANDKRAAKEKADLEKVANDKRTATEKADLEKAANGARAAKEKAGLEKEKLMLSSLRTEEQVKADRENELAAIAALSLTGQEDRARSAFAYAAQLRLQAEEEATLEERVVHAPGCACHRCFLDLKAKAGRMSLKTPRLEAKAEEDRWLEKAAQFSSTHTLQSVYPRLSILVHSRN